MARAHRQRAVDDFFGIQEPEGLRLDTLDVHTAPAPPGVDPPSWFVHGGPVPGVRVGAGRSTSAVR